MTTKRRPPYPSQPVLWWHLINDMEAFSAVTGWGLASIWGLVHQGDYAKARTAFDTLRLDPFFADKIDNATTEEPTGGSSTPQATS